MKDDIVGKLERHLQKPLDDESWVVYLLAEVRKLREKVKWSPATPALRMCCHWSLHVDLDHPSTVSDFFEPIERWITHTVAGLTPLGSWTPAEEHRLFRDLLFLESFRHELRSCLRGFGLATELCDDDARWMSFIRVYALVIEDGSLTLVSKTKTNAISSVMFSKGRQLAGMPLPFVVRWDIALSDGRWGTLDLGSLPTRGGLRGISQALQIS